MEISSLIHDDKYFTKEEIQRRAKEYEYPVPIAVEYFLWDCELTAQLQSICPNLTLKGGAAAQLHLPLERQRGSKDVDLVTTLDLNDIPEIIAEATEAFSGCVRYELHQPKKPTPNLPLQTYFAHVPSKIDPGRTELEVKIDFLCKCPELSSEVVNSIQTYALETKSIKCSTAGTLIGDKLLSLAEGSIGLDIEENYPKQIYDVDALMESCDISKDFVEDFRKAVDCLTITEASYRNIVTTTDDVLENVMSAMHKYSLVDMPGCDAEIKQQIDSFQQFYVSRNQRRRKDEWSTKALRIRFLALLTRRLFNGKMSIGDIAELIAECRKVEYSLNSLTGLDVPRTRKGILALAKDPFNIQGFRDLNGKPLLRVFWQILTPDNIAEIESLI